MALADSVKAIAAVTDTLAARLRVRTNLDVSVGRPEPALPVSNTKRLNLFLYEIVMDASLKNVALDEGQNPPLWLVLKYLLTAFEVDGKTSDSILALENLGVAIGALQESAFLPLPVPVPPATSTPYLDALKDNPENLKLTFDDAPLELLSKAMQGSDEKYRLSVAFQVRPVMIAPAEPPSYSLLVGVDYTTNPATTVGVSDIHIAALPSLGPSISEISPVSFEPGATVTIYGTDLHLSNLSVSLGPVMLPVTMQRPDELRFVVREDLINGSMISAGSLPVSVSQLLPSGRRRASNLLVANLRPVLTSAVLSGTVDEVLPGQEPPPVGWKFASAVDLTGKLLGQDDVDDFYLALYRDGETIKLFEKGPSAAESGDHLRDTSAPGAPQTAKQMKMWKGDAVPPGKYKVLYRVNGQQALQASEIDLTS